MINKFKYLCQHLIISYETFAVKAKTTFSNITFTKIANVDPAHYIMLSQQITMPCWRPGSIGWSLHTFVVYTCELTSDLGGLVQAPLGIHEFDLQQQYHVFLFFSKLSPDNRRQYYKIIFQSK